MEIYCLMYSQKWFPNFTRKSSINTTIQINTTAFIVTWSKVNSKFIHILYFDYIKILLLYLRSSYWKFTLSWWWLSSEFDQTNCHMSRLPKKLQHTQVSTRFHSQHFLLWQWLRMCNYVILYQCNCSLDIKIIQYFIVRNPYLQFCIIESVKDFSNSWEITVLLTKQF